MSHHNRIICVCVYVSIGRCSCFWNVSFQLLMLLMQKMKMKENFHGFFFFVRMSRWCWRFAIYTTQTQKNQLNSILTLISTNGEKISIVQMCSKSSCSVTLWTASFTMPHIFCCCPKCTVVKLRTFIIMSIPFFYFSYLVENSDCFHGNRPYLHFFP